MVAAHFPLGELSWTADQPGIHRHQGATGTVLIEDRDVLLKSFYARTKVDLVIITPDGARHLIEGFYVPAMPPALTDGGATTIPGETAALFACQGADSIYTETERAAATIPIGQARSVGGTVSATHVDGTAAVLKAGDPLYLNDIIETGTSGRIGLVLIDGTTLALGEKGELVLDEFLYDHEIPGKAVISLISGAAEFISGQIAKSGMHHMIFNTPVATIGIRGTKVFVAHNSDTGVVTVINRPTDLGGGDTIHAGEIFLTLPDGTSLGPISSANGGWYWNPRECQAPKQIQLTESEAQAIVVSVENLVNSVTPRRS